MLSFLVSNAGCVEPLAVGLGPRIFGRGFLFVALPQAHGVGACAAQPGQRLRGRALRCVAFISLASELSALGARRLLGW